MKFLQTMSYSESRQTPNSDLLYCICGIYVYMELCCSIYIKIHRPVLGKVPHNYIGKVTFFLRPKQSVQYCVYSLYFNGHIKVSNLQCCQNRTRRMSYPGRYFKTSTFV